jgi:riboflavin synthase
MAGPVTPASGGGPGAGEVPAGSPTAAANSPWSVSQLAAKVTGALERGLPDKIRVVGEVSGFRERTHWYFDLKDEESVVSCAMFANAAKRAIMPATGDKVVVTGRIDFYAKQGKVTLIVPVSVPASAKPGDSIATNGCCLTVVDPLGERASFDLLAETLRLTNLGDLHPGSVVNIEPSLLPTDRMGGHFVTGHIDGCGEILFFGKDGADWRLDIKASDAFLRHVVRKGCVAVDGMSLTVADVIPGGFRIWIIPHTLAKTALRERKVGDAVNLEGDLLGKYVLSKTPRR